MPVIERLSPARGFLFIAPLAPAAFVATNLQRFHEIGTAVRRHVHAPAFWLIGTAAGAVVEPFSPECTEITRGASPTTASDAPKRIETIDQPRDDFSYAWLFVQPPDISPYAWLKRCREACAAAAVPRFVLRASGATSLISQGFVGEETEFVVSAAQLLEIFASILPVRPQGRRFFDRSLATPAAADEIYAAIPHCNSSAQMFTARGILGGFTGSD